MKARIDKDNKTSASDTQTQNTGPVTSMGSAAFQSQYFLRDTAAGLITGAMAIPLSIGIAIILSH